MNDQRHHESAWKEKHRMRRGHDGQQNAIMYCRECRGVGPTLAQHCPGRMLTDFEEGELSEGTLLFINGFWWVRRSV